MDVLEHEQSSDEKPMLAGRSRGARSRWASLFVPAVIIAAVLCMIAIALSITTAKEAGPTDALTETELHFGAQAVGAQAAVLPCTNGACEGCALDAATRSDIQRLITSNGTVLVGIPRVRCTVAAQTKLASCGVHYQSRLFSPEDIGSSWNDFASSSSNVWKFMDCAYHTEINGMTMHSYLFVDGQLLGSGFAADEYDCSRFAQADGAVGGAAEDADADAGAGGFFQDISEWLAPVNRVQMNYGVSVTDVDGDHIFEAFVCGYGYPNTLIAYRDGRASDMAPALGLAAPSRKAIGVASCDMDGDGAEEIYVLNTDSYGGTKQFTDHLFRRSSSAAWLDVFESEVNAASRSSFAGRSVACVDRTGNGTYEVAAASYGKPLLLYQMVDAARGAVRDIGPSVGFVGTTGGRGLTGGPLFPGKDYRTTPGMDVYMDNENGASYFFRNTGDGTFTEVAGPLGLRDSAQNGRGVALLDANADGLIDIAVGNWNGPHRLWLQAAPPEGRFVDAAPEAMRRPSPIRTVVAADFDNDGYVELFFNNICTCPHDMPSMCTEPNRLFKTVDGKAWEQVAIGSAEEMLGHGTGAAAFDMDGDGLLELLISHGESKAQPLSLHRVAHLAAARRNHWLRVLPLTRAGAPARGALVTLLDSSGRSQVRVLDPGSGYLCQQEPVAHFGLGSAIAESVTIIWPGGERLTLNAPEVDRQHVVNLPR